jgi:hypothetical protein
MQDGTNMQATPDIGALTYPQLTQLRERIEDRVREMRETGGPALRERFIEEAAAIGMSLEEVVQLGSKRRGRPAKDRDGEGE